MTNAANAVTKQSTPSIQLTEVNVLLLGLALDEPDFVLGMMRLFATSTTSLPLNFFSSSLTSLC